MLYTNLFIYRPEPSVFEVKSQKMKSKLQYFDKTCDSWRELTKKAMKMKVNEEKLQASLNILMHLDRPNVQEYNNRNGYQPRRWCIATIGNFSEQSNRYTIPWQRRSVKAIDIISNHLIQGASSLRCLNWTCSLNLDLFNCFFSWRFICILIRYQ